PPGAENVSFTAFVSDLKPHTTYTFRAIGRNTLGTTIGPTQTFTTINRPPFAEGDLVIHSTSRDFTFEVPVLDLDGDTLTVISISDVSLGTAIPSGINIRYVGGPAFPGNETVPYTVSDGFGGTVSSNVTLTNTAPLATNITDHSTIGPGGSWTVNVAPFVRDNDGAPPAIVAVSNPAHGTATFNGTSLTYTANTTDFAGNDSFSFTVSDPAGATASAVVTLTNSVAIVAYPGVHPDFGPGGSIAFLLGEL